MDDSENPETASPTSHVKSERATDNSFSGSKDGSLKEFPLEETEKTETKSESGSDSGLEEGEKEREILEANREAEISQSKDRPGLQVTCAC